MGLGIPKENIHLVHNEIFIFIRQSERLSEKKRRALLEFEDKIVDNL